MKPTLVYITASSREEAVGIGRALVKAKLAACANVIPEVTSIYRWKGDIVEDAECSLIAKTTDARVEAVIAKVKELHSYECPCVIALPITAGHPEFLEWIGSETK